MTNRPALSKGEMVVARALWAIGPARVREIHEEVVKNDVMGFSTVQTYLRRLESKGYASSRLEGRVCVFSTKARPTTVIRETVVEFVNGLFGGETLPLVRHLIEEQGIDEAGLNELRQLIDRCEAEVKNDA